jgi:hypothetical protein
LKFEKIDSNNESKGHTSWAYLLHSWQT